MTQQSKQKQEKAFDCRISLNIHDEHCVGWYEGQHYQQTQHRTLADAVASAIKQGHRTAVVNVLSDEKVYVLGEMSELEKREIRVDAFYIVAEDLASALVGPFSAHADAVAHVKWCEDVRGDGAKHEVVSGFVAKFFDLDAFGTLISEPADRAEPSVELT